MECGQRLDVVDVVSFIQCVPQRAICPLTLLQISTKMCDEVSDLVPEVVFDVLGEALWGEVSKLLETAGSCVVADPLVDVSVSGFVVGLVLALVTNGL